MKYKHLFSLVKKIHKELTDREKEYARKNIKHRLREDWGYAFYTGKLVAYTYVLHEEGYSFKTEKALASRLLSLGIQP